MPLLRKAAAIDILVIGHNETTAQNTPEALKDHLARRRLSADVHHLFSRTSDVHDMILSFAADVSADMLVMGTPIWMGHASSIAQRVCEHLATRLKRARYPGKAA